MRGDFSDKEFDLLVIGGGITGAGLAWEAASRGYSVALVEKGDWGAATSAGCFRIAHGGIRYLQHLNLLRLQESVREQYNLRRLAPHLVQPFPFLVPCYGQGKKSRSFIGLGAKLYDLITLWRNRGFEEEYFLPGPRFLSAEEVQRIAPGLLKPGLTGGVVFHDCRIQHCERLTLNVVYAARNQGAKVANYMEVVGFECPASGPSRRRVAAVKVVDRENGQSFDIKTKFVINAAGPWIPALNQIIPGLLQSDIPPVARRMEYSKGVQIVLPQMIEQYALTFESSESDYSTLVKSGNRSYFLFPWRGRTLLGTSEKLSANSPNDFGITKEEINGLLEEARSSFQSPFLDAKYVKATFGGLRQLDKEFFSRGSAIGEAPPSREDQIIDYAMYENPLGSVDNLMSVGCVKYTTFRSVAEEAVNQYEKKIGKKRRQSITANLPLWGSGNSWPEFVKAALPEMMEVYDEKMSIRIMQDYAQSALKILPIARSCAEMTAPVFGTTVSRAEICYSLREEMVEHLSDIVFRRSEIGLVECPSGETLKDLGGICQKELGWNAERLENEIKQTASMLHSVSTTKQKEDPSVGR